jgi:hypothetical protein
MKKAFGCGQEPVSSDQGRNKQLALACAAVAVVKADIPQN